MLKQIEGSRAVAEAVALCRPEVICAYPISPQTHIVEGLGEIVKSENLKVDRERVQTRLNDLAAAYPNADEVRRAYLQNADAMRSIESAVLEDQVVDWVVEKAKITDKPSTFSELTGFGQSQAGAVA